MSNVYLSIPAMSSLRTAADYACDFHYAAKEKKIDNCSHDQGMIKLSVELKYNL